MIVSHLGVKRSHMDYLQVYIFRVSDIGEVLYIEFNIFTLWHQLINLQAYIYHI